jgi:hypothetical protein
VVSISRCVGGRCQIRQVRTVPTAFCEKDSRLHLESWISICHLISLTPPNCLDLRIVCGSLISFNLLQLSEVAPGAFMSGIQFMLLGLPLRYVARHRDRLQRNHCSPQLCARLQWSTSQAWKLYLRTENLTQACSGELHRRMALEQCALALEDSSTVRLSQRSRTIGTSRRRG